MNKYKWYSELLENPIVWILLIVIVVIIALLNASEVKSEKCDTMLCGWCQEYPELCDLYPYPYPIPELRNEYLPVVANALFPTLAPTMPIGTPIPYPTPAPTPNK